MSSKIYLIIVDYLGWYFHTQALLIPVRKHKLNQEPDDETVKKNVKIIKTMTDFFALN